ncbi:acyl-CoA dehydrogenase family protein [Bacillus sp. EB600]|uniref:acyl-CoA dehydrogenase family protein n=1 Tax=Bacillus sp. EB600 TaxID=2806345 RepID=UPI00210CCF4A|nr:acyl-CoA dehydrogenase family protein [Bacillus sp. EB600]MCQ6281249.1 acyl-CoA/acyl-ACP dehydrogenase [Bacillus sp. EB600]
MTATTDVRNKIMTKLKELTPDFQKREGELDELNSFPYQNVKELKEIAYTTLTLPKVLGGEGISLTEFLTFQEQIAKGCGSTALSIGWHMGIILEFAEHNHWKKELVPLLSNEIQKGALINTAESERNAGSPLRGARPTTTAVLSSDQQYYIITGEKTFTSASPVLDFIFVTATLEDGKIATFLVPKSLKGVSIRETWDSVALRGTASHDLILDYVEVPVNYLMEYSTHENKNRRKGWLLHIPACYLGIAGAARDYAVKFAANYVPTSLGKPIGTLPNIQQQIGEMELKLLLSKQFLFGVAAQYEESPQKDYKLEIAAVKTFVTNQAIEIVDLAMRIVGARSLSQQNPLHRYYQNARAGLHNPPMDDITLQMLAENALK